MRYIDINCDMGEGMSNDALIMPYIHSANIACGYHAGDTSTIRDTISLALENNVSIGAHVSFFDPGNFGRTEMNVPLSDIYELVIQQLFVIKNVADKMDAVLKHVKPHGALYNIAARDRLVAKKIAAAVKAFDPGLVLYGLSGSCSIDEARNMGLVAVNEVFADRTYRDDGSLTPRSESNALISDTDKMIAHVQQIIVEHTITTVTGRKITIEADSICIHGDGPHAIDFAKAIHQLIQKA